MHDLHAYVMANVSGTPCAKKIMAERERFPVGHES
ncbi:MAG: hypothetical protein RLZZ282_697 [Verrucomicrobiota bacterium]